MSNLKVKTIQYDKGRLFFCGDLHGCYSEFMSELKEVSFDKTRDLVVCTGDLVDRGRENLKCLKLVNEPWFETVIGNHEQMMYEALRDGDTFWWRSHNGGDWFERVADSEKDEACQLISKHMSEQPYMIVVNTPNKKYAVCHASFPSKLYKEELGSRNITTVLWDRDRFYAAEKDGEDFILGVDQFFFGHTPVDEVTTLGNTTYLDTGLVFTGNLGLVEVEL